MDLVGKDMSKRVRVMFDTGSQETYISQIAAASELKYDRIEHEALIHSLIEDSGLHTERMYNYN